MPESTYLSESIIDPSKADDIHTAKKEKRAPIPYSLLCVFNSKSRTKAFTLVLYTNQT